jgi:hypothetical protein
MILRHFSIIPPLPEPSENVKSLAKADKWTEAAMAYRKETGRTKKDTIDAIYALQKSLKG